MAAGTSTKTFGESFGCTESFGCNIIYSFIHMVPLAIKIKGDLMHK